MRDDGTVSASVKLQELFGLADTRGLVRRRTGAAALLAPNGRPVQTTRDREFWNTARGNTERLRGRTRHPWPEDHGRDPYRPHHETKGVVQASACRGSTFLRVSEKRFTGARGEKPNAARPATV
jgi:hypothetical protein